MAEMNEDTLGHLATVIEHFIHDEREHYESTVENGETFDSHIYLSLAVMEQWLERQPEYEAIAARRRDLETRRMHELFPEGEEDKS